MNQLSMPADIPVMTVDEKQYAVADLTPNQNAVIQQIKDLENQLRENEFKHQQLMHGRLAYVTELKQSLEGPTNNTDPEPLEAPTNGNA